MTNRLKILLSFIIVSLTNVIGHYFPPTSIMLIPLVIGLVTGLLITIDLKMGYRILLIAFTIMLNDILIKNFAGGIHDMEGAGFINLFLIIGLIISVIIIAINIIFIKGLKISRRIALIVLFPAIMFPYLQYFSSYGLSFSESMSSTRQKAIENKTFLSDLDFSSREIIYNHDSIRIISGWTEKELMLNHKSLLHETEETGKINYKIKIKHNFDPYDPSIYYKVNSDDVNGASPVDSVLEFTENKSDSIMLVIFKLRNGSVNNDTIIGKVRIKSK